MSLKQQLLDAGLGLTEDDFATHYSDLYVLSKPGVDKWLRNNYEHASNIRYFLAQSGSKWGDRIIEQLPMGLSVLAIDIPFANEKYWQRQK